METNLAPLPGALRRRIQPAFGPEQDAVRAAFAPFYPGEGSRKAWACPGETWAALSAVNPDPKANKINKALKHSANALASDCPNFTKNFKPKPALYPLFNKLPAQAI